MKKATLNERLTALKAHAEATLANVKMYEEASLLNPTMLGQRRAKEKMFECSTEYSKLLDEIARLEWKIKQGQEAADEKTKVYFDIFYLYDEEIDFWEHAYYGEVNPKDFSGDISSEPEKFVYYLLEAASVTDEDGRSSLSDYFSDAAHLNGEPLVVSVAWTEIPEQITTGLNFPIERFGYTEAGVFYCPAGASWIIDVKEVPAS